MFSNPMDLANFSDADGERPYQPPNHQAPRPGVTNSVGACSAGHGHDHHSWQIHMRGPGLARPQALLDIDPSESVERRTIIWSDDMHADLVQSTDHRRIEFRFRAPVHMLAVYERGERREGRSFVEGLPQSGLRDLARKLTFVPAGHEFVEWHEPRVLPRVSCFYFDPAVLAARAEPAHTARTFAPRLLFENTPLLDSALKLKAAIEDARSDNLHYIDALTAVLAHEVTRFNSTPPEPTRGGLAGWQQRAVIAYIEEHLGDQIRLATLSQIARLSRYHFCRAFKQSMGVSPHQHHAIRRTERAKVMLAKGPISVTEIGFALGFAQTSSFTAAFRRVTGITPTEYRRKFGLSVEVVRPGQPSSYRACRDRILA